MNREALEPNAEPLLSDAPIWFDNDEANAWLAGWSASLRAVKDSGAIFISPSDRPALEAKVAEALHNDDEGCQDCDEGTASPRWISSERHRNYYRERARIAVDALLGEPKDSPKPDPMDALLNARFTLREEDCFDHPAHLRCSCRPARLDAERVAKAQEGEEPK